MASNPQFAGLKVPLLGDAQTGRVDALGDVDALGQFADVLQRPLDSVKDGAHDAGAELHGQGLACSEDRVANSQAAGLLVHLD